MAPPIKKSAAERALFPTIAAAMHAGSFGRLLMLLTEMPAPEVPLPRGKLTDYGRMIAQGYLAGETQTEMRAREEVNGLSLKQHQRRSVEAYHLYGAQTSVHFIRGVVEVEGVDALPPKRITYRNQRDLARVLSPRQVTHWGLLSYGLAHKTIEDLFDQTRGTVRGTVEDTKADANLKLPHKPTTEFVLAQFFADGVLKPEDKYLPPDYVAESLSAIRRGMGNLHIPPDFLPEEQYPDWLKGHSL